jgi:hypothetical protein
MKKEIESEVKEALEGGKTHQEVFDNLKEKYYKSGKLLTEVLTKTPIAARRKQYYAAWIILLVILGLLAALRALTIIAAETGFMRVVNILITGVIVYIIVSVAKYEKYTFQFLGVLGLLNTYWIIKGSLRGDAGIGIEGFISLALVAGMCICSYLIYFKVFIKHKMEKVLVQYMDGSSKYEMQAKFTER